jgi:hypothetical protein
MSGAHSGERVPWRVARDAYAFPVNSTAESSDWSSVVDAVLDHDAAQRAARGEVVKTSGSERRAVEVLRKNHASTIAGNPYSEVHVARKHSAALLALLDRVLATPTPKETS